MRYHSIGGGVAGLSFEESLFTLYAPDGGMLMPETVPSLTPSELKELAGLSYLQLCIRIARLFIDTSEIDTQELTDVLTSAYKTVHPDLSSPHIRELQSGVSLLEMFNTPTLCFKDYAMCFTTALMNHFVGRLGCACVSLVATSGDTGGSAVSAIESLGTDARLRLIVLLPEGRISAYQRAAMTTSRCERVRTVSVAMDSDQLDDVIRSVAMDETRRAQQQQRRLILCTQNSANWGRVLFQIPAYFYAYFRTARVPGETTVKIFLPTGGCGNLTAACLARRMGLPIGACAATNENGAAHELIGTGHFQPKPAMRTCSVAMDIANPYNIPRLLSLFITNRARLSELALKFAAREPLELTDAERQGLNSLLGAESATTTESECLAEIVRSHSSLGLLVCPHTACALRPALAEAAAGDTSTPPSVVFATAHPAKFGDLYRARDLPVPAQPHPVMERLTQLPERCDTWTGSAPECVAKLGAMLDQLLLESK